MPPGSRRSGLMAAVTAIAAAVPRRAVFRQPARELPPPAGSEYVGLPGDGPVRLGRIRTARWLRSFVSGAAVPRAGGVVLHLSRPEDDLTAAIRCGGRRDHPQGRHPPSSAP